MKKKLTLLIIFQILFINLFSQTQIIDKYNFTNLEFSRGIEAKNYLQLKQNEYKTNPFTDILLHFNNTDFIDETGNYTVVKKYENISMTEKKIGNGSAFFLQNREISFTSNGDTIFTPGRIIGDFTIEFWINPTIISEDTIMFSWKGVNNVDSEFISQKIRCYIEERKIVWEFNNLFIPDDLSKYSIKLKGNSRLIPNQWYHILVRYDSNRGMIESLVNNIPEAIKYTTDTEKENYNIYPPYVGDFSKNDIFIGEKFRGFIDEFRISEEFIVTPNLTNYVETGSFYTDVYDLSSAIFENITTNDYIKPQTEITYKYRISDIPFTKENTILNWEELDNFIPDTSGRYIQFSGDLYSDGSQNNSPLLENIEVKWRPEQKPPAPLVLSSKSTKNGLIIEWTPVKHYNIDGYLLYYGNKSNTYTEVIDVGKSNTYTLNNLDSKKIIYFSVRSYKNKLKSEYSIEKYNRPN